MLKKAIDIRLFLVCLLGLALGLLASACVPTEADLNQNPEEASIEAVSGQEALVSDAEDAPRDVLVKANCKSDCTCPKLRGCKSHHILCYQREGSCQNRSNGCEYWCPVDDEDPVPVEPR